MVGSFIRLNLFELVRVTTIILRAVDGKNIQDTIEGKGTFNQGLFIGEQVSRIRAIVMFTSEAKPCLSFSILGVD